MAKFIPDSVLDAQLATCEGDAVHACSAQPTTYTEAVTTFKLATQAITAGNYVKANGDTSGRKNTLTPPEATPITATGLASHVAVTSGTTLKMVTTCIPQQLTQGGTVDFGPFAHQIADPI